MRKLFVALLILSVMGGAFAQEKGSWGTLSGEATLVTGFNFAADPVEVGGVPDGAKLMVTYENTFGPFSLTLPLKLYDGYFGTEATDDKNTDLGETKAKFAYESGSLKVELPFYFQLNAASGGLVIPPFIPIAETFGTRLNATYDDGAFGFKIRFDDLLTSPALTRLGGSYKFMDGASELKVSMGGAYATEWWRASSYVLSPGIGMSKLGVTTGHDQDVIWQWDGHSFGFAWENIETHGIAYQYFVMPELSVGLAFVGGDDSPFKGKDSIIDDEGINAMLDVYLKHPVFGVKYDNETLGVSAMFALAPGPTNQSDAFIAAGFYFMVMPELKVNADISVGIAGDADLKFDPMFNAGLEVNYNSDKIIAGLGFKALNLAADKDKGGINFIGLNFILGYNIARDGDDDYLLGDENEGFYAGLNGHFNLASDKDDSYTDFGLSVGLGYKDYELTEKMKLSVGASLGFDVLSSSISGQDDYTVVDFCITPKLVWSVFSNGSITFEYNIGSSDLDADRAKLNPRESPLDINNLSIKFKWWL